MNKTLLGYVPKESPIYFIHPFVKLYFLLVVSLFPMFITQPEVNLFIMAVILLLMIWSRVDLRILRIYVPVAIAMGWIILLSYTVLGGTHPEFELLAKVLGIKIYWERLRDGVVVYCRILPMIATMVFFLTTSRERDVIVAMRSVRIPFVVTYVFAMALRSSGMVLEDFQIVRQAEQARGFDTTGKSLGYKIRKYVMYMIPLFALSLRRTEEFTNALVARGYAFTGEAAKVKRADYILTHYSFKLHDGILVALISILFIIILTLRYGYNAFSLDSSLLINWLYQILR
ncbi:MAG: energy-coupling factor transporter transmembrane component T [Anaerolineales bacterium]|jgi:energy-coupling factor transporter transmembrane protein EcfT|nr:energy-coupling factor transporter transmembrane component T [Anaerolineales bacterium]